MAKPIIAIVGRANVGKSQLFNRLAGQRISIVEDIPGVTRDRIYASGEWRGRDFTIIDTGGIEPDAKNEMLKFMRLQAEIAIQSADVIIFLTEIGTGITAQDAEIASMLVKSGKPIVLCVNKVDRVGDPPPELYEFYNLGLGTPYPISAVHGHGTGDLLDACYKFLQPDNEEEFEDDAIRVAVIGKPNVGKSSLINKIAGEERVIVSEIAGTTRDSIDMRIDNEHGSYIFIDTAGIRRKSKVEDTIEKYSVLRAQLAIERADICLLMIDAEEGVCEQDTKIAGIAHDAGKGIIICMNKWDTVDKDDYTMAKAKEKLKVDLAYMTYAPSLFISAKTGQRVDKLFSLINYVNEQNSRRITTGMLNEVLAESTSRVQPPTDRGRRLKIYYITQSGVKPPTFVMFCNDLKLFHYSYKRYIENRIREVFKLDATPIKMVVRERNEEKNK